MRSRDFEVAAGSRGLASVREDRREGEDVAWYRPFKVQERRCTIETLY